MEPSSEAVPPQAGTCRYPGCGSPARPRGGQSGARPRYCGNAVTEDRDGIPVTVVHDAMTAFRRRRELDGDTSSTGETRPVTAAITRAGAIRDDAVAAAGQLAAQLEAVLGRLAGVAAQLSAASPEAAEAQAEAARAQAEADTGAARAPRARPA